MSDLMNAHWNLLYAVRRDSEQEHHEHSGRSNKVNPITVQGLSLEEAANGVNTDQRTESLPSTGINERDNIEACKDEETKIVNRPSVDVEEDICLICLEGKLLISNQQVHALWMIKPPSSIWHSSHPQNANSILCRRNLVETEWNKAERMMAKTILHGKELTKLL